MRYEACFKPLAELEKISRQIARIGLGRRPGLF